MANACSAGLPAGQNKNCLKPPAAWENLLIADMDVEFENASAFLNVSIWTDFIKKTLKVFPASLSSYTNDTDDPNVTTSASGQKFMGKAGVPAMTAYLDSNSCDWNEMMNSFKGKSYQVFMIDEDGYISGRQTKDGKIKGFTANITAYTKGVALLDDKENSFPLAIFFANYNEFENKVIKDPQAWDPNELIEEAPLGLKMYTLGAYNAGDIDVMIEERCNGVYSAITDQADFEVIASNMLDTPAVTAVDVTKAAQGIYTLTVQKGAVPANLDPGDYVIIRARKVTSGITDYISNRENIRGV